MMRFAFVVALAAAALSIGACTDEKGATRVLQQQGYTNVQMTGYRFFMCSDRDSYSTGFKAKAPGGGIVEGAVCSSWSKGSTLRFD